MTISLAVSLIWLLALLAASAHVQRSERDLITWLQMALAFAVVFIVALRLSPQPNWIGILIGFTAIWNLIGGPLVRTGNLLGALCAALAAALQVAGGVPVWLAVPLAVAALVGACHLLDGKAAKTGPGDIALLVSALAAPAFGLGGDLVYGWHSATVLNRGAAGPVDMPVPTWSIAIVLLALLGGVLRGIWKRQ